MNGSTGQAGWADGRRARTVGGTGSRIMTGHTHTAVHGTRCWICGSRDTMPPFSRSERIPLLSLLLPVRWRYCRRGAHHFLDLHWVRQRRCA